MRIYIVETPTELSDRKDMADRWILRRAIVVSINEEAAVNWVVAALKGEEVFSGENDNFKFSRRNKDSFFFDPEAATVIEVGEETCDEVKGSRILAWELAPPR